MTTVRRQLLTKAAILCFLVLLIFVLSRFGPQSFTVLEPLSEEWEDLQEVYSKKERIDRLLSSLGPYSSVAFIFLQAFQVVVSPIPGDWTGLAGGYFFGKTFGFLLSIVGITLGSWIAFELARILGRPFVERFVKKEILKKFDFLKTDAGAAVSFLLFVFPGIPKDYLCYLLGLSGMRLGTFLIVSSIGRMPGTYILTVQGASLRNQEYIVAFFVMFISVTVLFFAYLYRERLFRWMRSKVRTTRDGSG